MVNENIKTKNNIFDFATKELSQDALLCWLINGINYKENKEWYEKAKIFLNYILKKYDKKLEIDDYTVKIYPQYYHIDIFVLLENKYKNDDDIGIIIEDKKLTSEHNNQIQTYKEKIQNSNNFKGNKIITVYYKPFEELYELHKDVIKIDREYMLKNIFNSCINNQIYADYKEYLEEIENLYKNIESISISNWPKKKESYYMVAKKYNQSKKRNDLEMMTVNHFGGSIFIDWYRKNEFSSNLKSKFESMYLSLSANYDAYELRVRGKTGIEYTNLARENIENRLQELCKENNLNTSNFNHKNAKSGSNIFLAKIKLCPEITYKELVKKIEKLEKVIDTIIEEI